ncbi:AraC-like DNA-binding protein [Catenulispora sp. MAP12-49]|uniref:helix-turn-helix transcriptional regulator n=1 Tax=unclassified Catenulispora TaxID=414885 RepID=UPI0035196897
MIVTIDGEGAGADRILILVAATDDSGPVGEREAARLGKAALDLAVAALADHVAHIAHAEAGAEAGAGSEPAPADRPILVARRQAPGARTADGRQAPETRRQALLARIESYVERNLGDPDLSPPEIAAHHHISVSYLHRLFQLRDRTVAAWIRHQRLERARADLADPRLRGQPVQAIAARWGFRHAADFSRAFRAAHGMPPGDYRHRVQAKNSAPLTCGWVGVAGCGLFVG